MSTSEENLPSYLQNVDYDDVLHLYRGWRRSERALEERNREFSFLRAKSDQLQESHTRFRAQIQSLETIKDFAMKLQSQLSVVQGENAYLLKENKELVRTNSQVETQAKEWANQIIVQTQACKDAVSQADTLRGLSKESMAEQKEISAKLVNEVAARVAAEVRLDSNDELISTLRFENNSLRKNLDSNIIKATQCDMQLEMASEQISYLSEEAAKASIAREMIPSLESEVSVLKGDISRLLRLMDHYPASKEFLQRWHVSDGLSFIGMGASTESISSSRPLISLMNYRSPLVEDFGEFDGSRDQPSDETRAGTGDITPGEFYQLKVAHGGGDPFPMTASFEAESELWVPRKAAHIGLRFLAEKIPHAPRKLITDFLRKINKVWLRREERKFLEVKAFYECQVSDLKRQFANLKPYDDVMANNDIRRLRAQVRVEHCKVLKGRARNVTEMGYYDMFEEEDDVLEPSPIHTTHHTVGRLCEQVARRKGGGSVITVSKEKLLEASLLSLQTLGRQYQAFDGSVSLDTAMRRKTDIADTDDSRVMSVIVHLFSIRTAVSYSSILYLLNSELTFNLHSFIESEGIYPHDLFLRGALWLSKNILMIIEELAESLDNFRSKYVAEVTAAAGDGNLKRSRHRLNLLATTCINEALSVSNKSRVRARDIIQNATCLAPGDLTTFREFERTLPIESSLPSPSPSPTKRGGSMDRSSGGVRIRRGGSRECGSRDRRGGPPC